LVDDGLLRKEPYQDHPERFEYRLTAKGLDLWPVLMALLTWGDRHAIEGPPSVVPFHQGCGGGVDDRRMCTRCGVALGPFDVRARFNDPERGQGSSGLGDQAEAGGQGPPRRVALGQLVLR
jgi:HxlR-like helix-turn-helix